MRRHFRAVYQEPLEWTQQPTLWIANHTSWWDGIVMQVIHPKTGRKFHAMMLETELKKNPFLARLGAFSIQPGSRSMVESLRYATNLLQKPENTVLFFPQGRIHSLLNLDPPWMPGLQKVIGQMPENGQVLFTLMVPEYGSYAKPTLCIYHERFRLKEVTDVQAAFRQFQAAALERHQARMGDGHFKGWK